MVCLKVVAVFLIAGCVFSYPFEKRKCSEFRAEEALNCSRLTFQDLLQEFSGGIPDLGVKPLDPIYLDQIEVVEDALGFKSVFPFLRVTGFKNAILGQGSVNDDEVLWYTLKFDFVAEGPIRVELLGKNKVFIGNIKYTGGATGKITHVYSRNNVHRGSTVKSINVPGPEKIVCESFNAKSELDDELVSALQADPDVQAVQERWIKIKKEHEGRVVCAIAEAIFKVAVNNIRSFVRADLIK